MCYPWVLLLLLASATARSIDNRIVGGQKTTIEKHPHQVSLQFTFGVHICGGSIIKANYVLTAGHCFAHYRTLKMEVMVQAGSTDRTKDGTKLPMKQFVVHPQFRVSTMDYDVAVITLVRPFNLDKFISQINLVPISEKPRLGEMMTITGWGTTQIKNEDNSATLQVVRIPVVENSYCAKVYVNETIKLTSRMFCAGGGSKTLGPYKGDSGGPVTNEKKELAGIVSWGYYGDIAGHPSVFTDLSNSAIRKFIDENIK